VQHQLSLLVVLVQRADSSGRKVVGHLNSDTEGTGT